MAGTQITTDLSELEDQRYGYNGISFDDWTDGAEPVISGYLEDNGGLYYFNAEDIDNAAAWGGIANSTLVYLYLNPATIVPYLSTTAPAWYEAKNGYYIASSPTHRCYGQIFKDSSGNWDQKTILIDKHIGSCLNQIITPTQRTLKNDDLYNTLNGAADVLIEQLVSAGADTGDDFNILKPCTVYFTSSVAGSGANIQLKYSGGYINQIGSVSGSLNSESLNPGTYRINNSAAGTSSLYVVGVYGTDRIEASEIIDT